MDEKAKKDKLVELIKDASIAMLVTINDRGQLESRPMGVQEVEFDGDLWFFVYDDADVSTDVKARPSVNVAISDSKNNAWVSLSGEGEVVHDRAKAEELWSPLYKTYFPDGLDTPGLALIRVRAESAQYWDSPSGKVVYLLGLARALVTGKEVNQGENETIADL